MLQEKKDTRSGKDDFERQGAESPGGGGGGGGGAGGGGGEFIYQGRGWEEAILLTLRWVCSLRAERCLKGLRCSSPFS